MSQGAWREFNHKEIDMASNAHMENKHSLIPLSCKIMKNLALVINDMYAQSSIKFSIVVVNLVGF